MLYDRILQNINSVVVVLGRREDRILATYSNRLRMCVVESNYLLDKTTSVYSIGGTLVHEATHAYLYNVGIRHKRKTLPRIEQICTREEIKFYNKAGATNDTLNAKRILNAWRAFGAS